MLYTNEMREAEREALNKRWEWLLDEDTEAGIEGIDEPFLRLQTAILLENAAGKMVEKGDMLLTEAPVTTDGLAWPTFQPTDNVVPKVILGLVRSVFPVMIAQELVSVQALSQRVGLISYINWKYGNSKGNVPAGGVMNAYPYDTSPWATQPADRATGNRFAGFSAHYFSKRIGPIKVKAEKIASDNYQITTPQTADGGAGSGGGGGGADFTSGEMAYPKPFSSFVPSASVETGSTKHVFLYNENGRRVSNVVVVANGTTFRDPSTSGVYELELNDIPPGNEWYVEAIGNPATTNEGKNAKALYEALGGDATDADGTTYDGMIYVAYEMENTPYIAEMDFEIKTTTIEATEEMKLKTSYTPESKQDYQAFLNIDPEQELMKAASQEMNYSLNRQILAFIMDEALADDMYFNYDWSADIANNTTGNYLDRHRALAQKILSVSNMIFERNRIAPANWIVVSPRVASLLGSLGDDFVKTIFNGSNDNGVGMIRYGTVQNKLRIYVDPNWPVDMVLFGYKGAELPFKASVVFAPYATWMSPTIYEPSTAEPRRFIFSRYGIYKVPYAELNYAVMTIDNLPPA